MSTHVIVSETAKNLHHPITKAIIGKVISRVYEGENVQRHSFMAKESEKEYALGPTTEAFHFRDWPEVFKPVLDRGFEVKKLYTSRGGLKIHATLADPKGAVIPDPVSWDKDIWGGSDGLQQCIQITGGIKPGSGFHYRNGFFRQVCTNGLVLEFLGLGRADFNHITFDSQKAAEALFGHEVTVMPDGQYLLGKPIGSRKALAKVAGMLERINEPDYLANQPEFARDLLAPLGGFPDSFVSEAVAQFMTFINNAGREVHEIDIANALTSAENRIGKVPGRVPFRLLNAQHAITKLTGIMSL